MLFLWVVIFIVALAVLVKSADWFLESAEDIGLALGLSPFIIGITIVSAGTSFPELISAIFAVLEGVVDVPIANAVGSNVANILLVGGVAAVFSKGLRTNKRLLMIDMALLIVITLGAGWLVYDGQTHAWEAIVLLLAYAGYIIYTALYQESHEDHKAKVPKSERKKVSKKDAIMLVLGTVGLFIGAKYLIEALIEISSGMNVSPGLVSLLAVALGTSLPELTVSVRAALNGKANIVIGNIVGSNIFNVLMVIGVPALFTQLTVDQATLTYGLPAMAIATVLLGVFILDKHLSRLEGTILIVLYAIFIVLATGILG